MAWLSGEPTFGSSARLSKASDKFPIEKRREEFVTAYASTTPEEDFAEHFAAYIVCPTEFRRLASTYPALSLKYGFMKELFEGKEFEDRYYKSFDDISTPIDFDFDLKRKLLEEADERAAKDVLSEEVLNRGDYKEKKNRNAAVVGPKILPVSAIDDPKEEKAIPLPSNAFPDLKREVVISKVLHKTIGRNKAKHADSEEIDRRLWSGQQEIAIKELMNRTGIDAETAAFAVECCKKAIETIEHQLEQIDEELKDS